MKIALLADIHGNAQALEVVLKSARNLGVERLLIAGDLVGYYYGIKEVLQLLMPWEWFAVRGNHEEMLHAWCNEKGRTGIHAKYGSGLEEACTHLSPDQLDKIISLSPLLRSNIHGKRILMCHGAPWDLNEYIYPDTSWEKQEALFDQGVDLLLLAHTHYPMVWEKRGQIVINPGSVGQPRDYIPGACWALWDTEKHNTTFHRERYDTASLISTCRKRDPYVPYLVNVLTRTRR